jgi:hypothetical protein
VVAVSLFHRANDAWLLALIGLHLAAVAWYTIVRRQQIVRGMITGDPAAGGGAGVLGGDSLLLRAALIVLALGALLALLLEAAPDAAPVLF